MPTFLPPTEPVTSLDDYLASEMGGEAVARAQAIGPQSTIAEVERSGLRGRAGGRVPDRSQVGGDSRAAERTPLPRGQRRRGRARHVQGPRIAASQPLPAGRGLIIAAFAVGATEVFVCLKASFEREIEAVTKAVQDMQSAGVCTDCKVTVVGGPDEYLFGEEKAMLEVIEGKPPLPRLFPPYVHGLFASGPQAGWEATPQQLTQAGDSNPTLVNNVETLSNVPHILLRGADWFRSMGTADSAGNVVATVVGDVVAPDVVEVRWARHSARSSTPSAAVSLPGRTVKAVLSGVANAVVTGADLDIPLSYEGFEAIGSGMGAAGFIVCDDATCMVDTAYRLSRFLSIESCGQCSPCKLGSGEITGHRERLETRAGSDDDLRGIGRWLERVDDGARCYLATEEQVMVSSILRAFPEEFAEHVERGRCPRPKRLPIPKLVDLADGRATYDETFWHKRPDWTYDPA